MKIRLKNGKSAPDETVSAIEAALGCPLSGSFKTFLTVHDGAEPESNRFKVSDSITSGIRLFIPAVDIPRVRRQMENIPQQAYPVARDDCGNYVLIDEGRKGSVSFWDHEVADAPIPLAPNFPAFLDLLEPFDISTPQLRPGQVKKVWVDPQFLESLKK